MKTMTLTLDELDYASIQKEIAERQKLARAIDGGKTTRELLPDGDSCLAGSIIAECMRDLAEYRALWESEHPK